MLSFVLHEQVLRHPYMHITSTLVLYAFQKVADPCFTDLTLWLQKKRYVVKYGMWQIIKNIIKNWTFLLKFLEPLIREDLDLEPDTDPDL